MRGGHNHAEGDLGGLGKAKVKSLLGCEVLLGFVLNFTLRKVKESGLFVCGKK